MNRYGLIRSLALIIGPVLSALAAAAESPRIPAIAYEKYTLQNGLDVILHEDHTTPIVGVNLWYHAGSNSERPGRTGFAHLFEHMMFQGSQHYDKSYFGPLQEAGGRLNGSTSPDRTNYWETLPSNYLELALWMESDRMGFLLPAMTQEKFANQRDVVKNERRQSYENRPYGLVHEVILAAMYAPDHPYSWPTIGAMTDLDAASRDDVADFFRRYYHPGNASLCIAGDFQAQEAKRLVARYFGSLPAGPKPRRLKAGSPLKKGSGSEHQCVKPEEYRQSRGACPLFQGAAGVPELKQEKRIRMTDRVGLARIYITWHTVPHYAPDDAELDVLAHVLAGDRTSRLYRSLVREKQVAQDVEASHPSGELAGRFSVVVTARSDRNLAEVEKAVAEELRRIETEPPTAEEIARVVNSLESGLVRAMESISGFGGRADRLNMYNTLTGDPGYLSKDFERYLRVDGAGAARVAKKYLGVGRVVVEVTPGSEVSISPDPRQEADKARSEMAKQVQETPLPPPAAAADGANRKELPTPAPQPKLQLPPIQRSRLSNGMEVIIIENHELPLVHLSTVFPVGRARDPANKPGLAATMASVWDQGTRQRSAEDIAAQLSGIGASLYITTGWDTTGATLFTLKRQLPKALEVYADVLRNPSFPQPELDRQRAIALGRLEQVRNEPRLLAAIALNEVVYGPHHPYGQPLYGTPAALRSITREDLAAFHQSRVRPDQAGLIVVGDVSPKELIPQLEASLAGWKAGGGPAAESLAPLPQPKPTAIILVDKPGAAQSVISVAMVGAERKSPDYFPLVVMNSVFGGQFSSRLNLNLREQKGYTYGARSTLDWRVRERGPYVASASVQTAVTAPALVEFLKEFAGMAGERPVVEEEIAFHRKLITRGYPENFETPGQLAGQLETLLVYGLPDDYFNTVVPGIGAVTAADVLRVAKEYLKTGQLAIVIVGDRAKIEAELRKLPAGKKLTVCQLDDDFRLAPAAP